MLRLLALAFLCLSAVFYGIMVGQTRIFPYQYAVRLQQNIIGHNIAVNTSYDTLDTIYKSRISDNITLIGDSHVQYGDWSKLLHRNDVTNLGIGGERSSQLRNRLGRYDIAPSVIVISIGTNDIDNMSLAESDANTRVVLAEAQKRAKHVIFLAPPPTSTPSINANIRLLREQQRLACGSGCFYLDLTDALSTNGLVRAELSADGIHLKDAGYQIIATALRDEIARYETQTAPAPPGETISMF
ncbi:lysophospholipase L1-like esterase [Neorhizobium sp. JUb45]|nr:lysophospholipase L1-like esterase [Neorhizobium sp. JUb45]